MSKEHLQGSLPGLYETMPEIELPSVDELFAEYRKLLIAYDEDGMIRFMEEHADDKILIRKIQILEAIISSGLLLPRGS